MGTTKHHHRWRISLSKSPSTKPNSPNRNPNPNSTPDPNPAPPPEFLCPISRTLMSDPVIVSSGHTFDRPCVLACKTLALSPTLPDGSTPDFSIVIPNLALKSSILKWVSISRLDFPTPIDPDEALRLVRKLIGSGLETEGPNSEELIRRVGSNRDAAKVGHAESELLRSQTRFDSGESSVPSTPLQLATRPSCFSSASSGEVEEVGGGAPPCEEEEEYVGKMKSAQVEEQEEAVVGLRRCTRSSVDSRVSLCTSRVLSALRSLILSKHTNIQVNTVAALVNLSLEKVNKVKIVRAGFIPPLVEILKFGSLESQEHASGALFSLALDDNNKTAIGVLGALHPLIHMMVKSNSHDAALALYHLSLVQSNRLKLVKLGSVPIFMGLVRACQMTGRALLILSNLSACSDGRAAMMDAGAVETLVGLLKGGEFESEWTKENCVAALWGLSRGGLRFKVLAKATGAAEVLKNVAEEWRSERAREKARRVLEVLKAKEEDEEEEVDWEKLLELGLPSRTISRGVGSSNRNS